jgi:hypothetical protein
MKPSSRSRKNRHQRVRYSTNPQRREMQGMKLPPIRQLKRDHIAAFDSKSYQSLSDAVNLVGQPAESELGSVPGHAVVAYHRHTLRAFDGPAIEEIGQHTVRATIRGVAWPRSARS